MGMLTNHLNRTILLPREKGGLIMIRKGKSVALPMDYDLTVVESVEALQDAEQEVVNPHLVGEIIEETGRSVIVGSFVRVDA